MVIVCQEDVKWTDKKGKDRVGFYLDGYAKEVCDAVVERVSSRKQDILMLFAGQEGSGKTGASINCAYYIAKQTARTFTEDNVFFNIDDMMKFAGNSKEQVIVWDESALGGLASSWSNASQIKLKSMLMVCRKLRHVFMFNIPRFYRLSRDLIERAYCMFQIYEDDDEVPGNFMFFGRDGLENLFNEWKRTNFANYRKHSYFYGHFVWRLPFLINEKVYEDKKDAAIMDLVEKKKEKEGPISKKYISLLMETNKKYIIEGYNQKERCKMLKIDPKTLRKYEKLEGIGKQIFTNPEKNVIPGGEDLKDGIN